AIPAAPERDRRLRLLHERAEEAVAGEDEEGWEEEVSYADDEDEDMAGSPPQRAKKAAPDTLSAFLAQQSKGQLIELLKEQAKRHPGVRQALQDRSNLAAGSVKKLVHAVRAEINELDDEPEWDREWANR